MPRRKSYDDQMSVPVESEVKQRFEDIAEETHSTVAQLVRVALDEYLQRQDEKNAQGVK